MKLFFNSSPIAFKSFRFSGGETQVRIEGIAKYLTKEPGIPEGIRIEASVHSADALMEVLIATDALRNRYPGYNIHLVIPYLPYARQDRACAPGEAFALKVLCDILNAQHYATVTVWDVHSAVALNLLERVVNLNITDLISTDKALELFGNSILVVPDKGATGRVSRCAFKWSMPMIQAEKHRDPDTGNITHTSINTSGKLFPRDQFYHFAIVDDICDGGRTFVELARVIRQEFLACHITLFVTHGIFSAGFDPLLGLINRIVTANSFVEIPDPLSLTVTVL